MYIEQEDISPKDEAISMLLALFFGLVGAHRFYLGKWKSGLIYLICSTAIFWGTKLLSAGALSGWSWFWIEFCCYAFLYIGIIFDVYRLYSETMTDGKGKLVCSKATKEDNGIFKETYAYRNLVIMWICIAAFIVFLLRWNGVF